MMLACFPEATERGSLIWRDDTVEHGLLLNGYRVSPHLSRVPVLIRSPSLGSRAEAPVCHPLAACVAGALLSFRSLTVPSWRKSEG